MKNHLKPQDSTRAMVLGHLLRTQVFVAAKDLYLTKPTWRHQLNSRGWGDALDTKRRDPARPNFSTPATSLTLSTSLPPTHTQVTDPRDLRVLVAQNNAPRNYHHLSDQTPSQSTAMALRQYAPPVNYEAQLGEYPEPLTAQNLSFRR